MLNLIRKTKKYTKKLYTVISSDMKNKLKYGRIAPVYAERIWINPNHCKAVLLRADEKGFRDEYSGLVVHNWPPINDCKVLPLLEYPKIKSCIDHWGNGIPWEDTHIYQYCMKHIANSKKGRYNGCKNMEDIVRKYDYLDSIFYQVKKDNRVKTAKEVNAKVFREEDGILIHIGPNGNLFVGGSFHRFAMALALDFKLVPAQIGCVHYNALHHMPNLRLKNC